MPIRETFDIDIRATDNTAVAVSSAGKNVGSLIRKEAEDAVRASERMAQENRRKLEREANQFRTFLANQSDFAGGAGTSYTSRREQQRLSDIARQSSGGFFGSSSRAFEDIAKVTRVVAFAESAATVIGSVTNTIDLMLNNSKMSLDQLKTMEKSIADGFRSIPVANIFFDMGQAIGNRLVFGEGHEANVAEFDRREQKERENADRLVRESLRIKSQSQMADELLIQGFRKARLAAIESDERREAVQFGFQREDINLRFTKLIDATADETVKKTLIRAAQAEHSALTSIIDQTLEKRKQSKAKNIEGDLADFFGFEKTAIADAAKKADEEAKINVERQRLANDLANEAADIRRAAAEGISDAMRGEAVDLGGGQARRFAGGQDRFGTGLVERFEQDRPLQELKKIVKAAEETNEAMQIVADKLANSLPVLVGLGLN